MVFWACVSMIIFDVSKSVEGSSEDDKVSEAFATASFATDCHALQSFLCDAQFAR
jgi:hypothetical protein